MGTSKGRQDLGLGTTLCVPAGAVLGQRDLEELQPQLDWGAVIKWDKSKVLSDPIDLTLVSSSYILSTDGPAMLEEVT